MVLEALEDHRRGWIDGQEGMSGERVARASYAIEHVMPREWAKNWPITGGASEEAERDRLVHTIGNLTLLTGRLNSKVSNGPWVGKDSKRAGLEQHDVLLLNRALLDAGGDEWTDDKIRLRSRDLTEIILQIWPAPEGHRANHSGEPVRRRRRVGISDLLGAGMLSPGQPLYPRVRNPKGLVASVLADGRIEVAGSVFETPSGAAAAVTGKGENGWWYFLVDPNPPRTSLRKVWRQYVDQMTVDVEEDDDDSYDDSEEDIPDADG